MEGDAPYTLTQGNAKYVLTRDLPIGIGWDNNIRVTGNFIYMRGFAPTTRSTEYNRKSAIAGMRVTNYDGQPKVLRFINEVVTGNT
jgi:hypothetical protein